MKPRRFDSETIVSRSRTDAATSSVSTGLLVTKGSPLIRDRGMAARDDWSTDRSRWSGVGGARPGGGGARDVYFPAWRRLLRRETLQLHHRCAAPPAKRPAGRRGLRS